MPYRLAIVEDNATARANLRSLILPLGEFEISSFASGQELKQALRKQNFELILFDFHLGQQKNGVEWVQDLRHSRFIKPSTGVGFITSDRLPQTIGQIIDAQPDMLIIKPYTTALVLRNLKHYLSLRKQIGPVLLLMDDDNNHQALEQLNSLYHKTLPQKLHTDLTKLEARLLMSLGKTSQAKALFESVLLNSDKILWAQWGRIKCQYLEGNWYDCQAQLANLLTTTLARDKAFEWLACLCFEQQAYDHAEYYLDRIKVSELSGAATRLKSLTYQKQDRILEGLALLEKKREYNRTAKERFNEFTFELAEFYLAIAEQQPHDNRTEALAHARRLIGLAGRNQSDLQLVQKRDFLLAHTAILDQDLQRAGHLIEDDTMGHFERTDTATLITASKVYAALNQPDQAKQVLALAKQRNQNDLNLADRMSLGAKILDSQRALGLAESEAKVLNRQGTKLYLEKALCQAMQSFYEAYELMPGVAAYGLNLLQSMVEDGRAVFRSCSCKTLLESLEKLAMNDSNRQRFRNLKNQILATPDVFMPTPPLEANPEEISGPSETTIKASA
ncbi:response regulator [Alteromonas aestuariivivens]|uniref:Response regulator n=1 Tax=Alteromonas aestuariivivens TaxID=1938339 RepID=A0A3D8M832_9ALTE|nr:response regulator [Alteromonas aestuariivivens]RDV26031.1 response regulator [Alteromonas aestuariivivens]